MITPGAGYGDEYEGAWVRDSVWGLEGDLDQMPLEALGSTLNKFCDLTAANGYMGDGFSYRHPYEDPYDGTPQVDYYYDVTPRGQTPLDTGFYLCVMAFLYGKKLGFNSTWDAWFTEHNTTLDTAFSQVSYTSGLIQNTQGLWGDGQMRLKPAGVYTDTVLFRGGIVCASIVAYAAACAMADLYELSGNSSKVSFYEAKATALRAGIRSAVLPSGWLPHTVGGHSHTNSTPSPEATAHAIAYGILTKEQALTASALFVSQYEADKTAPNGLGQIFLHAAPARGGIRQLRKQDDYSVGAVFPEWLPNAPTVYGWYQNGGYWFWRSGDVAYAMQLTDPDASAEFMEAAIDDAVATSGAVWESADTDGYSGGNTGTLLLRDWGKNYLGSTTTFVPALTSEPYPDADPVLFQAELLLNEVFGASGVHTAVSSMFSLAERIRLSRVFDAEVILSEEFNASGLHEFVSGMFSILSERIESTISFDVELVLSEIIRIGNSISNSVSSVFGSARRSAVDNQNGEVWIDSTGNTVEFADSQTGECDFVEKDSSEVTWTEESANTSNWLNDENNGLDWGD